MKFLSQNASPPTRRRPGPDQTARRRWFAGLLWGAFPGDSMAEKARRAAPVLDLTPRQIEKLMKGDHDAKLGTVLAVLTITGAERVFDIITGPGSRDTSGGGGGCE